MARKVILCKFQTCKAKLVSFFLEVSRIHEYKEAFSSAARYIHVGVTKCLKHFFTTEIPLSEQKEAILLVAGNGHLEIMKVLMDNFTNLGKIVNGKIIRAAACNGDIEMIKYFGQKLDDHQFEILLSDENDNGETIFHDIAKVGHLKVLKYLCQERYRFARNILQKDHFQRTPIQKDILKL